MRRLLAVGKLALGLYNCYDAKNWHDVMRVTLARAGPVALAFDCTLVCFGFPFAQARRRGAKSTTGLHSAQEIAAFVAESTSIGEGGQSFAELVGQGRLAIEPFPERGFPARWGEPVATTPTPAPERARSPRHVAEALAAGRDQLLVFGLGPRGLPSEVLADCPAQLEITGRGIHLDTAAALGALPAMVRAHQEHLGQTAHGDPLAPGGLA